MAKEKLKDIKLSTPEDVWRYYCVVNCFDQEDLEDDVREWIIPLIDKFDADEIKYVMDTQAGKNISKEVVFDLNYFATVLEMKASKEKLEKEKPSCVSTTDYALNVMADALLHNLQATRGEELVKWAEDKIIAKHGPINRVINFIKADGTKVEGVTHKQFETVLELATMGQNVMLVGPAGTGKSFLTKQLAEALGAHYYKINSPQQPYEWEGFVDAKGDFIDTPFTLFAKDKEMSVLDIEEIDNMNPSVGVKINDSLDSKVVHLANGEVVDFSSNHIFVASANTWGTGATADYVGRNQLDAATTNRWVPIIIDYDPAIEEAMCPNNELLNFLRDFRKQVEVHSIHHIVSYRNIKAMYDWVTNYPDRDFEIILKAVLIRNLEPNDLSVISGSLSRSPDSDIVRQIAEQ